MLTVNNGPAESSIRYCIGTYGGREVKRHHHKESDIADLSDILEAGNSGLLEDFKLCSARSSSLNWNGFIQQSWSYTLFAMEPAPPLNPASQILSQMRDLDGCRCPMNLLTCPLPSADTTVAKACAGHCANGKNTRCLLLIVVLHRIQVPNALKQKRTNGVLQLVFPHPDAQTLGTIKQPRQVCLNWAALWLWVVYGFQAVQMPLVGHHWLATTCWPPLVSTHGLKFWTKKKAKYRTPQCEQVMFNARRNDVSRFDHMSVRKKTHQKKLDGWKHDG